MKSNSQLNALRSDPCPSDPGHPRVKIFPSLLILLGITSALAQNNPSLNPTLMLRPEVGPPPTAESAGSPLTGWDPASTVGPGLGAGTPATPSPMALAQPTSPSPNTAPGSDLRLEPGPESIWENGVGEGFRPKTQSITLSAGALNGIACFGGQQAHDIGLLSLTYGRMLGNLKGTNYWYRGNFEGRLELFGGMQFHPDVDTDGWVVGLTPHLPYNFATGTRWIPFVDLGAGVTATGIGPPDLSGTFEFNLQAVTGILYLLTDKLALSLEARYIHMSCAHIHNPNLGVNGVAGFLGLTYFL